MNKKIRITQVVRFCVQLIFMIFFGGLFTLALSGIERIFSMIINGTFDLSSFISFISPVVLVVVLTITMGRFFCSWLCGFGALNDFIYMFSKKIFKIKFKVNPTLDAALKYLKYFILLFIIVFVWTLKLVPADNFSAWTAFGQIGQLPDSFFSFPIAYIIFALICVGAMFIERFFCRYLCPLGGILAILSVLKMTKIKKPTRDCGKCKICTTNCPMGLELYKMEKVHSVECIACMKCIDVCPRKNTRITLWGQAMDKFAYIVSAIVLFISVNITTKVIKSIDVAASTQTATIDTQTASDVPSTDSSSATSSSTTTSPATESSQTTTSSTIVTNNTKPTTTTPTVTANKVYKDGVYTGSAHGYKPNLTVQVTLKNDKITNVQILSTNDSDGFKEEPIAVIPKEIIAAQSTSVNAVSGATYTSRGIMNAVANALTSAKI